MSDLTVPDTFAPLRDQLLAAAREFADEAHPFGKLIEALVADVQRASAERVEIFPVCHHSPASAAHMVRRLRERPPRVIFMELCEDLRPVVDELKDCTLPVALQAFANEPVGFPGINDDPEADVGPLSVVAPLTDFSAEFQAIAYTMNYAGTELVFVDRSVDHVFQWRPKAAASDEPDEDAEEGEDMHGGAVGVELGQVMPTFDEFLDFLLVNARVGHFSEWWQLYVEQPTLGADTQTYREVMFLVGSLIRRLGSSPEHLENCRLRERYMWTRIKRWLVENEVDPSDAMYICGAAHSASEVPEYGTQTLGQPDDPLWDIPARSGTQWLYGFIPSSFSSIERQFGHPRGTISLAMSTWEKAMKAFSIEPFALDKKTKRKKTAPTPLIETKRPDDQALAGLLTTPPALAKQDEEQLLGWCTGVVQLARKNGYLASTADAIAIYETSVLLASMRSRRHPSPYDFVDAAITCLEKASVPGKRSVRQICGIMLGGDRVGHVGYSSAPPLLKDLYDRLAPLGVSPKKRTITRALMDFRAEPHLREFSDLLWRVHYLLPDSKVARPIMGERRLGETPAQESWDILFSGAEQRDVIQLSFEGVTVEQVLEIRLRREAFKDAAKTVDVLRVIEAALLYLDNPRLVEGLGHHATQKLTEELGADDAPEIFERARRLVHYHRSTPRGVPDWLRNFVATGYQHYATLLPQSFGDRGTSPGQLAGMLSFVFTLESLALAMGCQRSQLLIAIRQAGPQTHDTNKVGLLWAAEWLLELRTTEQIRASFDRILDNPMTLPALPGTLSGFLLALSFTPLVAKLAVELLSRAFCELPDAVLMPWMPGLIATLKPHAGDLFPALAKEAAQGMPGRLDDLDTWTPPWELRTPAPEAAAATPAVTLDPGEALARDLLFAHRASADGWAAALGVGGDWTASLGGEAAAVPAGPALSETEAAARGLPAGPPRGRRGLGFSARRRRGLGRGAGC
ncbi:MAG: hypothetical protein H6739_39085 [Alphaproteobacteria bacterium]|nr:hypothetical protein [Alphaproteobacteria bacterium]